MRKRLLCLAFLFAIFIVPTVTAAGGEQELTEADKKISAALGEQSLTLHLWPDSPPDEDGEVGPEQLKSPEREDRGMRIADVERPTITISRPEGVEGETPAVLVSPGGAYNTLAFEEEGVEIVEWLNSLGVTGILLKYRVPRREEDLPKHYHALQDAQRAMGIIRHNAEALRVDPDRIGVLGFSAGGHLSAKISGSYEERLYEPVDEADEESCRPDFAVLIYPAYLSQPGTAQSIEPIVAADELSPRSAPPTFIAVSQRDGVMRGCMVYFKALTGEEVPAELHIYEKGEHGGGMRKYPFRAWADACSRWMKGKGIVRH